MVFALYIEIGKLFSFPPFTRDYSFVNCSWKIEGKWTISVGSVTKVKVLLCLFTRRELYLKANVKVEDFGGGKKLHVETIKLVMGTSSHPSAMPEVDKLGRDAPQSLLLNDYHLNSHVIKLNKFVPRPRVCVGLM